MRPDRLQAGREIIGCFSHSEGNLSNAHNGKLVRLTFDEVNRGIFIFLPDGCSFSAIPEDQGAHDLMIELQRAGLAGVCWVLEAGFTSKIILQAHIFSGVLLFSSEAPLQIAITDAILQDLPRAAQDLSFEFFEQEFLMEDMAFAIASPEATGRSFRLIGENWLCDARMASTGFLECLRLVRRRKQEINAPVSILRGSIEFVDTRFASKARPIVLDQLQDLFRQPNNYLAAWETYNELEEKVFQQEACEIGCIRYTRYSCDTEESGDIAIYTFYLDKPVPHMFLVESLELEASSEPYVCDEETGDVVFPKDRTYVGEVILNRTRRKNELMTRLSQQAWAKSPPEEGYLMRSVRGDQARIKRRDAALARVREARCPLLSLPLLLEKGDAPTAQYRHNAPLSNAARRVLGHEPTASQYEALDVALNTPDIALIQGPPGTGKTSVIRALLTRLLELNKKHGEGASILLTSYQHDAVDNAASGIDLGGLPANRVGGRRGVSDEEKERGLWEWARKRQEVCLAHVKKLTGGRTIRTCARDVDRMIDHWRRARGGPESISGLFQGIIKVAGKYLDTGLVEQLRQAVLASIRSNGRSEISRDIQDPLLVDMLKRLVEDQRFEQASFLDDGPSRARKLLFFLKGPGASLNLELPRELIEAAEYDRKHQDLQGLDAFLRRFEKAIRNLISCFDGHGDQHNDIGKDIEALLSKVSASLHEKADRGTDGVAEALEAFAEELDNLSEIKRLVEKYSGVEAGTCQQIVPVHDDPNSAPRYYDVVIIDEAARANPLDLLIPMSLGKRIILVGDHKQLPQVLEPQVLRMYQKEHQWYDEELLSKSLFERLYESFLKVQEQGGPRRVVTLSDEFRMHPVIGGFVSRTFYDGKVTPRCSIESRLHNLGKYGDRPVCWLDVPISRGQESDSLSKFRSAEVSVIVEELDDILRRNREFTIGVITFYAAQAGLLKTELGKLPHDDRTQRVLVGTVDAFQGREFDIVFLSTVRSNRIRDDNRKRLGFLECKNRLCVAFSRAKRLLVVVGDSDTVAGEQEKPAAEPLRSFYDLCRSEEGWYETR